MKTILKRLTDNLNDSVHGKALCRSVETPRRELGPHDDRDRIVEFLFENYRLFASPTNLNKITREIGEFVAYELLIGPIWAREQADKPEAKRLAYQFTSGFGDSANFYSTYSYETDSTRGTYSATGTSVLDTGFDMGLFAVDTERIGILWLGDED